MQELNNLISTYLQISYITVWITRTPKTFIMQNRKYKNENAEFFYHYGTRKPLKMLTNLSRMFSTSTFFQNFHIDTLHVNS